MKKLLTITFVFLILQDLSALEIKDRIITVTNSAEVVLSPDEVEIEITLQEESGNSYIAKVEEAFWVKLGEHGVDRKQLSVDNVNVEYYWYHWWKIRESSKKTKKIVLKLDSKVNLLNLMKALNKDWVLDVRILSVSNKNLAKTLKEVQVTAIKEAKAKAQRLLTAIDEEVGEVVSVIEIPSPKTNSTHMQMEAGKVSSFSYSKVGRGYVEEIPEIRLVYAVKTQFRIKDELTI